VGFHPINRLHAKDVLKSPSYLFMLILLLTVPLYSLMQILKTNVGPISFIPVYVYLMFNVSMFLFLNMITINMIVISEKTSGRCEYYLANKVDIRYLSDLYSRSSFILSIVPIFIFNLIMLGYSLISRESVMLDMFVKSHFVWFILSFLFFTYTATCSLTFLSMLSKSPERIRTYLSVSSFLFTFAAMLPGTFIKRLGLTPGSGSIVLVTAFTLFTLGLGCATAYYFLKRKLNNESVILSYRQ
jgi:hypothetical protein